MDKRLIAERFAQARNTYNREAKVQGEVAAKMLRLLLPHCREEHGRQVVEIGCGTGVYSRMLLQQLHPHRLWLNDLCPEMEECVSDLPARFLAGDAEGLPLPCDTRLITSCSTLQWFVHPEAFFRHCYEALTSEGLLAFSTFGPDNLIEIKQLTGNGLTYPSLSELTEMLAPHFRLLHAEEERATLCFEHPTAVLKHLKETGVTGTEKRVWTRGRLQAFCDEYIRQYSRPDGRVALTYHPIYIIAQKTSDSL